MMDGTKEAGYLGLLSSPVLGSSGKNGFEQAAGANLPPRRREEILRAVADYGWQDFGELWGLAAAHHVIMRALPELRRLLQAECNERAEWVERVVERVVERMLEKERARIHHALSILSPICAALEELGDVVVIKSLDHWPDLGSDIDLYTNAAAADVAAVMANHFGARVAGRSWGDRLANKWNFIMPGLPELVEVHAGRLGQTGEQTAITSSLLDHAGPAQFESHKFRVPAAEDRLIITTLQRMYRHFYLRICDVANTGRALASNAVEFRRLYSVAASAGLWDGLATYLVIVAGYIQSYGGEEVPLPPLVTSAARFGAEQVRFRRRFLRVPIFPQAAGLYISEWQRLLRNGELQNATRLSLLPALATSAALALKFTGSDKGVW